MKDRPVFIIAGRLGKSLTCSKAKPVKLCFPDSMIYIFREEPGFPIEGCIYITLPQWLIKLKPALLKSFIRNIYEPFQIIRHALIHKPVLIIGITIIPKGYYAIMASKLCKAKAVINIIGNVVEIETYFPFKAFWRKMNLWLLRKSDAIATKGSHVNKFLVSNGIPEEKVFTFNGFIDTEVFKSGDNLNNKEIDILFAGAFRPLKGPDRVLRVIENIAKEIPDIKAVFIGNGQLFKQTQSEAERTDTKKNIDFIGYTDDPSYYFKRSKLLLLPSMSEGLPTVMLEAMASGCVPIVSNVGNITDAAFHEKNSMVVEHYNDIGMFTYYSLLLLKNNNERQRMAEEGLKTVINQYTLEKQSEEFRKIIKFLKLNQSIIKE